MATVGMVIASTMVQSCGAQTGYGSREGGLETQSRFPDNNNNYKIEYSSLTGDLLLISASLDPKPHSTELRLAKPDKIVYLVNTKLNTAVNLIKENDQAWIKDVLIDEQSDKFYTLIHPTNGQIPPIILEFDVKNGTQIILVRGPENIRSINIDLLGKIYFLGSLSPSRIVTEEDIARIKRLNTDFYGWNGTGWLFKVSNIDPKTGEIQTNEKIGYLHAFDLDISGSSILVTAGAVFPLDEAPVPKNDYERRLGLDQLAYDFFTLGRYSNDTVFNEEFSIEPVDLKNKKIFEFITYIIPRFFSTEISHINTSIGISGYSSYTDKIINNEYNNGIQFLGGKTLSAYGTTALISLNDDEAICNYNLSEKLNINSCHILPLNQRGISSILSKNGEKIIKISETSTDRRLDICISNSRNIDWGCKSYTIDRAAPASVKVTLGDQK